MYPITELGGEFGMSWDGRGWPGLGKEGLGWVELGWVGRFEICVVGLD